MTTMKAGVAAAAFSGLHFYDNPSKGRVYLFTAATAVSGMIFCKMPEEKIIYFFANNSVWHPWMSHCCAKFLRQNFIRKTRLFPWVDETLENLESRILPQRFLATLTWSSCQRTMNSKVHGIHINQRSTTFPLNHQKGTSLKGFEMFANPWRNSRAIGDKTLFFLVDIMSSSS